MFDSLPGSVVGVEDSALIDTITSCARVEAQAAAARLAAIAELTLRRCDDEDDRELWACDGWDAAAAEISAALTIGPKQASGQMSIGVALLTKFPRVGAVFAAGGVSAQIVSMITWRTRLVTDPDVLAMLDAALSGAMTEWGVLSKEALAQAIDGWVHKFDPVAVIRSRSAARSRTVRFGQPDDETGTVSVWALLLETDAALLQRALTEIALTVCADDPRTLDQRRADAFGVLAVRGTRLACLCGQPACPATSVPDAAAAAVIIHVLADAVPEPVLDPELRTRTAAPAARSSATATAPSEPRVDSTPTESTPPTTPVTPTPATPPIGYLLNGKVIPPNMLADLVARGAKLRQVARGADLKTVDRYRPTAAMADFVRMRAMTCTAPGCTRPAIQCDVDHVIPWPFGPTHPGNLGPKCRKHHLLKTFYGAPGGWRDEQLADGTVVWTSPTGHQYRKVPGSRILFPDKNFDTPLPPTAATQQPKGNPGRGIMMPTRRRTRAQDRAARIDYERKLNEQEIAEASARGEKPSAATTKHFKWDDIFNGNHPPDDEPPPF